MAMAKFKQQGNSVHVSIRFDAQNRPTVGSSSRETGAAPAVPRTKIQKDKLEATLRRS
jgi:hypothetical protein